MKTLDKTASAIMDKLVAALNGGDHATIANNPNTSIMAVHVEALGRDAGGRAIYSVAHYYEQQGDLMRDPDMEFLRVHGKWIPTMFRQDGGVPVYQESMWQEYPGRWSIRPKLQADHTSFANTWLRNIKEQQRL